MSNSWPERKRKALQERLEALIEEYEAVSQDLISTLGEDARLRCKRRLKYLEAEIDELGEELARLPLAGSEPRAIDRPSSPSPTSGAEDGPDAIAVLRAATKLVAGDVAQALLGSAWKPLRQDLLTRASRFPRAAHLDVVVMQARAADAAELMEQVRASLAAQRAEPRAHLLNGTIQRVAELVEYLIAAYRLRQGDALALELILVLAGRGQEE